ncbi:MAG: hypothetical protein QXX12_03020 [Nanopusillaceae archaeon]
MAWRKRRRTRTTTLSKTFRRYVDAFVFLALGPAVVGLVAWLTSVIPTTYLTIGFVEISNAVFFNIIGFATGIVLVLTGLQKLRVRL